MGKTIIGFSIGICFLLVGSAFASCEDGESMAVEAALDAAKSVAKLCRESNVRGPKDAGNGDEDYWVNLTCRKNKKLAYRVTLHEVEDAVCYVKKVKLLPKVTEIPGNNPEEDKIKCPPKGMVINCMPPTTNPYCKPATRRWVQANCPGVSYLD